MPADSASTPATPATADPAADTTGTTPEAAGGVTAAPGEGTPAPAGTTLSCGDFGGGGQGNKKNCPEDESTFCYYRTCNDDETLTRKCVVPAEFDVLGATELPADAECVVLQLSLIHI